MHLDPLVLCQWAKWAYFTPSHMATIAPGCILHHNSDTDATAYTFKWPERGYAVVTFRGTDSMRDVRIDLSIWPRRSGYGRIHRGFLSQWDSIKRSILNEMQRAETPPTIYVTGHSLGGALATIAALEMKKNMPHSNIIVWTFGAPRVGNAAFVQDFRNHIQESVRVVRKPDPVPLVPPFPYYCHPETTCRRFDENNRQIPQDRWAGVFSRWGLTLLNVLGSCVGLARRPSKSHSIDRYIDCFRQKRSFGTL